jgi:hypothetical protein
MSTNESEPTNKAEFLEQLTQSWAELEQTLDGYSDDQMTQRKDAVGWTVKDHLGHLISWEEGITALLKKHPRWEAMGVTAAMADTRLEPMTEDELNQHMRDQMQGLSLAEVRQRLRSANEALKLQVESMDGAELLRGYSHFAPEEPGVETGRPVLGWVDGNSNAHYREHLPWIRAIAEG